MKFEALSISRRLLAKLEEKGYTNTTPVQEAVIPLLLRQRDVVAEAVTGSGKTLAFMVPVVHRLLTKACAKRKQSTCLPRAVVITPTRELAVQIHAVTVALTEETEITAECIIGGEKIEEIVKRKEKNSSTVYTWPDIIIASPGKLVEMLRVTGTSATKETEVLVLDEADRLLSFGFSREIAEIMRYMPRTRQTAIFSATIPENIHTLSKAGMRSPMFVRVANKNRIPEALEMYAYGVEAAEKVNAMRKIVPKLGKKVVVFFATCAQVEYFYTLIAQMREEWSTQDRAEEGSTRTQDTTRVYSNIYKLHRKIEQKERNKTYTEYCEVEEGMLLSTDISARGLDFQNVSGVLHFDLPQDPTTFVHRSGRTARYKSGGVCIFMYMPNEKDYIEFLTQRGIPVQEYEVKEDSKGTGVVDECEDTEQREEQLKNIPAFIAYMRSYKEHLLKHILNHKHLDHRGLCKLYKITKKIKWDGVYLKQ